VSASSLISPRSIVFNDRFFSLMKNRGKLSEYLLRKGSLIVSLYRALFLTVFHLAVGSGAIVDFL